MADITEDVLVGLKYALEIAALANVPFAEDLEKADEVAIAVEPEIAPAEAAAKALWSDLMSKHSAGTLSADDAQFAADFLAQQAAYRARIAMGQKT